MRSGPYTTVEVKAAEIMWRRGYKLREMAEQLDRSLGSVCGLVQHNRDIFPHRRTRITTEMIREMRERWKGGRSIEKLALDYKLDHHTVSKYVKGLA
jgi:hypothetical protein